ncbi:thermonuclease family protein [bacterium]|nr:thermonuclease family protein [bacterium]
MAKRKIKKWIFLLSTLAAGWAAYQSGIIDTRIDSSQTQIIKIIDGDTFVIRYEGKEEKIRLIGIDTPESKANIKAGKDASRSGKDVETIVAQGQSAKRFVETLIEPGSSVRVELDVQHRDKYGRLLGYLYLDDGKMLNEEIIKAGYASPMTYPPNVRYEKRFRTAYQWARDNKKGLWQ